MIPTQIKLNLRVAFKVVLQGISVRFGRSIVTMMGVALGIAFLMSILAGQVIKAGVAGEQALRNESTRMFNFFTAETGVPQGLVLGLVECGPLNEVERRLLARIEASRPQDIRRGDQAAAGATALLVLGEGTVTDESLAGLCRQARHALVFATRTGQLPAAADAAVRRVVLERAVSAEERAEQLTKEGRDRFRNVWIVVISLFVTVIGISNSMLMSVTERFREIGTMKCLGSLSSFVRQMFLIESSLVGIVGAAAGAVGGALFAGAAYAATYGFRLVLLSADPVRLLLDMVLCVVVGLVLAVLAALYPARFASRMLPAHALRSDV